jgi:hypothetical protein
MRLRLGNPADRAAARVLEQAGIPRVEVLAMASADAQALAAIHRRRAELRAAAARAAQARSSSPRTRPA